MATSGEVPANPETLATPIPVPASAERIAGGRRWRTGLRAAAGVMAVLGLLLVWATCSGDISKAEATNASAIQITQLYAGYIFAAIITLGIPIGLYILSRAGE